MASHYEEFQIKGTTLIMNGYVVGKNELNEDRLADLKDEVFYQIIVLTDTIDSLN